MMVDVDDFVDKPLEGGPRIDDCIVLCIDIDETAYTNVPHLVTHHSPDGFGWGYGGSGAADLALNIAEWWVSHYFIGERRLLRKACWRGTCWVLAWMLHQQIKWAFISPIHVPRDDRHNHPIPMAHLIPMSSIDKFSRDWIQSNRSAGDIYYEL